MRLALIAPGFARLGRRERLASREPEGDFSPHMSPKNRISILFAHPRELCEAFIMVEVVAALIWDGDRFLICQRPAHKARGLLWEFVGGKVEPGETKAEALRRECREELDIDLAVGEEFMAVEHVYPDITVHLTLFEATIAAGTPKLLEHNAIEWITPAEIPNYEFCPADEEILARIRASVGADIIRPRRTI